MRELRRSAGISLRRAAELSGWNKSHLGGMGGEMDLSRVESGSTKPSLPLIEWYDDQFGAANPKDTCALVAQTMPDGTLVRPDHVVRKTWTLRNTGPVPWRDRWLTRQHSPNVALRCPTRVPVPDTGSGGVALIELDVTTPRSSGPCVAYFRLTDVAGRLYFPDPAVPPLRCSLYVTD
jgi:hypothetical protein